MFAVALLDPIYNALGSVITFFYAIVPSYGFAIIGLTLAVRTVLIPLTAKQVKSQRAMQQLQPELKKLQAKYKGDRQKLNEEMMKLYKEHKANPLAGCLPLILQMPVFIVLYRVIIDLSKVKHIPLGSELQRALVASDGKLQSFGMDLAEKPQTVIGLLMVAAVVGTGYYQQKQMTARLPKDSINPQMQMVTKVFPVFFGLISLSVPAGVVLYFIVSNLWQIGQQAVAFRTRPPVIDSDSEDPPKATGKASGGGGALPTKSGGSTPKGGGSTPKGGGGGGGGSKPKGGPTPKGGGSSKGGGPRAQGGGSGGGGGANRPPSGRVTPKGGPKASGRVTPKGGPGGAGNNSGGGGGAGNKGGKGASTSSGSSSSGSSSGSSDGGESRWSRLSPTNRAAKAKRPPPAARPKGLPPTKGSSGGSSRKEP